MLVLPYHLLFHTPNTYLPDIAAPEADVELRKLDARKQPTIRQ
jgi:hypothetical protein